MAGKFFWKKSPEVLRENVKKLRLRTNANTLQAVQETAQEAENQMKLTRPWSDITGNARAGLNTEVEATDKRLTIYFIHSVEYGVFLELARGGRYAVIVPTMVDTVPKLQKRLAGLMEKL